MTLPEERINAVRNTRRFLVSLLVPSETPRVPKAIREQARRLLKHYPWEGDIGEVLAETQYFLGVEIDPKNPTKRSKKEDRSRT